MTEPEFCEAVQAVAAAYREGNDAETDLLRDLIKTSLRPKERQEIVLGLAAAYAGGEFPAHLLYELDPSRSGSCRSTPPSPG